MSTQMIETVKSWGAFQKAFGANLVWLIECVNKYDLLQKLQKLNELGFLFAGSPSGWPAADVFGDLLEKKKMKESFKEIRSRGPGGWFIIER